METADLFTIVYGSSYLSIVIFLSIYCWIKLEDELIFIIQKITVEYKKIASATNLGTPTIPIHGNRSPSGSPIHTSNHPYQFSTSHISHASAISQQLQNHLSNASGDYGSIDFGASIVHGSFLRPIPDIYYEKFIKPFDIYLEEENDEKQTDNHELTAELQKEPLTPDIDQLTLAAITSTRPRKRGTETNKEKKIKFGVKFFYWVWVTWNMSSIYGLLIIHIWDIATDIAVMIKWYMDGSTAEPTKWLSPNGDIDLLALFILSIFFVLLYRIIAGLMIYSLTRSPWRVLSQIIFDLEIYRTIFISFKLKLSEPGYIQTWLQKLEATFESLPQAVLQISYLARIENWHEEDDSTVVITSILLSLVTMAERFERDDKLYFPYDMYYITKETFPYISFPYMVRFSWRLCESTCRTFIFVLIWLTIGGYLLSFIFVFEALLIIYMASREGKYDFLSYFVAIPLGYLKKRRTWRLTFIRLTEHIIMLCIIWLNVFIDFKCEHTLGCFSHDKVVRRLWLHEQNGSATFGFVLLICTTIMTFLTPLLYFIIWKWFIVKDISKLMATQERDVWVITKTGDIRGLTEMIEFGVNPDLRNLNNETLLHVYFREYISYNQYFVNVLSENESFYMGAMSVPGRRTILHAAVSHRMPSRFAIEFLLKQEELSINDTDRDGKTPIMYYLCANKYQQSLKSNVDNIFAIGANNNPATNRIFLRDANVDILRLMTDAKYGIRGETRDNNGNCIVHYACMNPMMSDNNIEWIIDLYLESVRNMFESDEDNIAESKPAQNLKKTSVLLTGKEHIELYNHNMNIARVQSHSVASSHNSSNKRSVTHQWEYILDNIDVKNRFHQTPFMFYLKNNLSISDSMINLFVEHGMDPLVRDGFRNSVFHWAVQNSVINQDYGCDALRFVCQYIEEFGSLIDVFKSNAKHESIFHTYLRENIGPFNENIILLFLDFKLDINSVDLKGNTCIHYACENVNVNRKFLLFLFSKRGGNCIMHVNVKNLEGRTPIDLYRASHSQLQFNELVHAIQMNDELPLKVNIDTTNVTNPIVLKHLD